MSHDSVSQTWMPQEPKPCSYKPKNHSKWQGPPAQEPESTKIHKQASLSANRGRRKERDSHIITILIEYYEIHKRFIFSRSLYLY
ncbi:hypothetical protein LguiA_018573 [Lonicera macranthoides]